MTLLYVDETENNRISDAETLARQVVETALAAEGFPMESEVSLTIVGGEEIRDLNREHRGIDAPTDVLSFPLMEYETVGGGFSAAVPGCEEENPETGDLLLGDIVLNMEKVVSQAEEFHHSVRREFAFLIAHSMLHLMGYDHIEQEDERLMRVRQHVIMETLGIFRGEDG